MSPRIVDLDAFNATALMPRPFEYLIVPGFVRTEAREHILRDFPKIADPGSFPVGKWNSGPTFNELIKELNSNEFRIAFEQKFDVDLSGLRPAITVRGQCSAAEGKIHTDSKRKLITALIYLNSSWHGTAGRLRLLRSGNDLDDVIAEVPPTDGTLVAFKRSDNSWHGYEPYVGERRVLQINWYVSNVSQFVVMMRHHVSARFKNLVRPSAVATRN